MHELNAEVPDAPRDVEADPPVIGGPWYTRLGALVCLGVGAFGLQQSMALGVGRLTEPGPGLWPLILSVTIMILSALLVLHARRYRDTEEFTSFSWLPVAGGVSLLAFWFLLPLVGFEIPAVLLVFAWLKFLGRESWRVSIVGSLATVTVFHLVFVGALGVPLPRIV